MVRNIYIETLPIYGGHSHFKAMKKIGTARMSSGFLCEMATRIEFEHLAYDHVTFTMRLICVILFLELNIQMTSRDPHRLFTLHRDGLD